MIGIGLAKQLDHAGVEIALDELDHRDHVVVVFVLVSHWFQPIP